MARECAPEGAPHARSGRVRLRGHQHLRFTHEIPSLTTVRLYDIRPEAVARLADEAADYFDGEIRCCDDLAECLNGADVLMTCTDGSAQVVHPEFFCRARWR